MLKLCCSVFIGTFLAIAAVLYLMASGAPRDIALMAGLVVWMACLCIGLYGATLTARDASPRPSSRPATLTAGGGRLVLIIRYPSHPPYVTLAQVRTRSVLFGMN
jgi:hypothetical protein